MEDTNIDKQLLEPIGTLGRNSGLNDGQCTMLEQFVVTQLISMKSLKCPVKRKEASQALWDMLMECGLYRLFARNAMNEHNIASLDIQSLREIIASGKRLTEVRQRRAIETATVHHRDNRHRCMVLKVSTASPSSNSSISMMFLRNSAEHLKDICHDHILKCFGSYEVPQERGIYLEYVLVNTVADLIFEYGIDLSMELIGPITYQVLRGLQYLHERKRMVHNAITCDTICFDTTGVVKIAGFGLSHCINEYETPFPGRMSVYIDAGHETFWLAPEVIGRRACSYPADIWSLGCLITEMCTSIRPVSLLANPDLGSTMGQSLTVVELARTVDEPYKTLLSRMITTQPEQRSAAAKLLLKCKRVKAMMGVMDKKSTEGISPEHVAANMEAFYADSCIGPRLTSEIAR
jgi:serine/threonine protein kinase